MIYYEKRINLFLPFFRRDGLSTVESSDIFFPLMEMAPELKSWRAVVLEDASSEFIKASIIDVPSLKVGIACFNCLISSDESFDISWLPKSISVMFWADSAADFP